MESEAVKSCEVEIKHFEWLPAVVLGEREAVNTERALPH